MEASQITTAALANKLQVKASPGALYSVVGFNTKASAQYIQVHDTASTPSNGAVPVVSIKASADFQFYIDWMRIPRRFSNGICVVNSSTAATYTAGSADCLFDALYV